MAPRLRGTFDLDGVAILRAAGTGWVAEQTAGKATDAAPEEASFFVALDDERALLLTGDLQDTLLRAFIGQLRIDGRRRQLRHLTNPVEVERSDAQP